MKQCYIYNLEVWFGDKYGRTRCSRWNIGRRTGALDSLHVLVETIKLNNSFKLSEGEALFFFDLSEKLFLDCAIVTHVWDSFRLITMLLYSKKSKSQVIMHKHSSVYLCKVHNRNCWLFVFGLHKSIKKG